MGNGIDGLGKGSELPQGRPVRAPERTPTQGTAPAADSAVPAGGDSVELTGATSRLEALARALGDAEPVDGNRVAAVRQALAEGQYTVDSRRIAERLLEGDA